MAGYSRFWIRSTILLPVDSARLLLREGVLLGIYAIGAAIVIVAGGIGPLDGIGYRLQWCHLRDAAASLRWREPRCSSALADLGHCGGDTFNVVRGPVDWPLPHAADSKAGSPAIYRHSGHLSRLAQPGSRFYPTTRRFPANNDTFRAFYTVWWVPALIFLLVAIGAALLMRRTVPGRHLYALGGNEEAARLSGLRIGRLKATAYSLGRAAALRWPEFCTLRAKARAMPRARWAMNSAPSQPRLLGAATCVAGKGTIAGTILGVMFLTIVVNGIANVIKVDSTQWEGLVMGLVLILAVAVNRLKREA